jgi:hypothetical protein
LWPLIFFIPRWDLAESLAILQELLLLGPLIRFEGMDSIQGIFGTRDKGLVDEDSGCLVVDCRAVGPRVDTLLMGGDWGENISCVPTRERMVSELTVSAACWA